MVEVQVGYEDLLDVGGLPAALGERVDYVERDVHLELELICDVADETGREILPILTETEVEEEGVAVGVVTNEE